MEFGRELAVLGFVGVDVMREEEGSCFCRYFDGASFQVDRVDVRGHVLVPDHRVDGMHSGSDHLPQTDAHRVEEENGVVFRDGKGMNVSHSPRNKRGYELGVLEGRVAIDFEGSRHFPVVSDAKVDRVVGARFDERMGGRGHRFPRRKHQLAVCQSVEIKLAVK